MTMTMTATLDNKRQGSSLEGGSSRKNPKRTKRNQSPQGMDCEVLFPALDMKNPDHVRRSEQRLKAISKGKNTAGYANFIKMVPKEKRRPRSMKTPATPDATLDIPNKRWNGMLKAWRRALHEYDPKDLFPVSSLSPTSAIFIPAAQKASGMAPTTPTKDASDEPMTLEEDDGGSPVSVFSSEGINDAESVRRELEFEDELWENGVGGHDSDDDLL